METGSRKEREKETGDTGEEEKNKATTWKTERGRSLRQEQDTNVRTYLKVELAELLLGVDVRVSRYDYGTGGEGHLSVRRLAVIRSDGGQTAVVPELLVQDGRGMAGRRCLYLTDVVQAQQERQEHDAEDEHAAGAAAQYLVHGSVGVIRVRFGPDSRS